MKKFKIAGGTHKFQTPGPGSYNPYGDNDRDTRRPWEPVKMKCFFTGCDECFLCRRLLYGDYYKEKSGHGRTYCHACVRSSEYFPEIFFTRVSKMRHCRPYHHHIDVEFITEHKTTLKKIRRLEIMEHAMYNKFGQEY